jgi:hypothetical protein
VLQEGCQSAAIWTLEYYTSVSEVKIYGHLIYLINEQYGRTELSSKGEQCLDKFLIITIELQVHVIS